MKPLSRYNSNVCALAIAILCTCAPLTRAALVSSGFPVQNPKYEMLLTDYGYADLALDRREGFTGREYLSGEWASAAYYTGGRNPSGPIWFQPQWFFPDWVSNSDFGVEKGFHFANPLMPMNTYGFNVYRSIITNSDLRVTMTYDTVDLGTNRNNRLALGLAGQSFGGMGSNHWSRRYLFRQEFEFENRSGGTLNDVKFYHFFHGLESGFVSYDDRDYGGAMSEYRYRIGQFGQSYSFDDRTMETVLHSDTMGVNFNREPSGYQVGSYGVKGVDSHEVGKPTSGVHLAVEADTFDSMDYFNPSGTGWVSGAVRFDLGSLAPDAKTSITALLGVRTRSEVKYPPVNIVVHDLKLDDQNFTIDVEETTRNTQIGLLLRQSTVLDGTPAKTWEPLGIPYLVDVPLPGWRRFVVPRDREKTELMIFIQPIIIKEVE